MSLYINDNFKFLQNLKQGFRRKIPWNKYRSEITTQTRNINFGYTIGSPFRNINRLFVLSFEAGEIDLTKHYLDKF